MNVCDLRIYSQCEQAAMIKQVGHLVAGGVKLRDYNAS